MMNNSLDQLNRYINFISEALYNRGIDTDDDTWKDGEKLSSFVFCKNDVCFTSSFDLGIISTEILLIVRINRKSISEENVLLELTKEIIRIKNQMTTEDGGESPFQKINILWIVENIESRIRLEKILSNKGTLKTRLKQNINLKKKKFNIFSMYYIDKDFEGKEIKLRNIKRYEMLVVPQSNFAFSKVDRTLTTFNTNPGLKGYVFTANLFDVVNLYNDIGDELFNRNLRLGIREQMGVDSAIKETLRESPQYFWFRNNGITILIQEPDPILDRVNELVLKQAESSKINFSVINGAQTINAAADYYFGEENEANIEESKKAQVIVRVIQIKSEDSPDEANKISISLNRQKPIKDEDIAFTNDFVYTLNEYLNLNNEPYVLCRRSETNYSQNAIGLIEFARARKACSGAPGEARSWATSKLLQLKKDGFVDKSIFVGEWDSKGIENLEEVYTKYYNPIFFAIKLSRLYEMYNKIETEDSFIETVIKNGKWYFVAFFIYVLNKNDQDYTNFNYSIDKIAKNNIVGLIFKFATLFKDKLEKEKVIIDSNVFKRSDMYKKLKDTTYQDSEFYSEVISIFGKE